MVRLGREIAKMRKELGKSLRVVAAEVELSHEAVRKVELGRGEWKTAVRVGKSLGISRPKILNLLQRDIASFV